MYHCKNANYDRSQISAKFERLNFNTEQAWAVTFLGSKQSSSVKTHLWKVVLRHQKNMQ